MEISDKKASDTSNFAQEFIRDINREEFSPYVNFDVEIFDAWDSLENNVNPIGSTFYAASTLICVPNSLAFNGPALGAQAGENRIKDVAKRVTFLTSKECLKHH